MAETINGLFKAEVIHRRGPWRSFDAVEYATLEWVDWFNNRRLLEPIGNIPPAEAGGKLLCSSGKIRDSRVTKTNQPKVNPARFSRGTQTDRHCPDNVMSPSHLGEPLLRRRR